MFGFYLTNFGELMNVFDQQHKHGDLENLENLSGHGM